MMEAVATVEDRRGTERDWTGREKEEMEPATIQMEG